MTAWKVVIGQPPHARQMLDEMLGSPANDFARSCCFEKKIPSLNDVVLSHVLFLKRSKERCLLHFPSHSPKPKIPNSPEFLKFSQIASNAFTLRKIAALSNR